ncbi:hypothetical protein FisN_19Hh144 [Fistulifera solaris]|uniref:Uncharacterized protein n=1 Tax=Fistulifera solaris TaxID=1519565 RepID=A0A1Z5K0F0_FISSO|nr:hypothetical protein FisN_19Hh144 [Fistulifera solaris]|eukprot:GAX19566.1 hypothetical protein FisN_19Hh144 [Fistulifera solaris]
MSYAEPDIVVDFAAGDEVVPLTHSTVTADPLQSGFLWYTPPMAAIPETHQDSGATWSIAGHDYQVLAMTLPPGEQVVTEIGTFVFGSPELQTKVDLTLCARASVWEGCQRILGGESCVKVLLVNGGATEGFVGITPNFPAKIMPLQFGKHISPDTSLIAQKGVYLSHVGDVTVGCDMDTSPITCCCAGLGCFRQKITGTTPSLAFLNAGGTIVYKQLHDQETITVDTTSIIAMEETVQMGIVPNGRCCTMAFGGECCFSTTLTGPGKVFLQSMSFYKFQQAVQQTVVEEKDRGGPNTDLLNNL